MGIKIETARAGDDVTKEQPGDKICMIEIDTGERLLAEHYYRSCYWMIRSEFGLERGIVPDARVSRYWEITSPDIQNADQARK